LQADCLRLEVRGINNAATRIQSAFRGFWHYSHFVILRYEVVRIQSIVRRNFAQRNFIMSLGCCIMIQTIARTYLARKQIFALKLERASRVTAAQKLREKRACKYVQFWWRVVLECRREKQAALVIERFFLMVKAEVDREIQRAKERKQKMKRRRKKRESDDKMLERVWLNAMNGDTPMSWISPSHSYASSTTSAFNQVSDHGESNADTMDYSERSQSRGIRHRASSPTMRLVMRHDQDREQAEENRTAHRRYERKFWTDKDGDTVMSSKSLPSNKSKLSVEDVALDQAMTAATTSMEEDTVISTEKYMKLYGLRSAPNKSARHFIFNNDTISTAGSTLSRTSTSSTWAATPSTSRSDTLRFSKLTHLQKTRKAMSPCQLESPCEDDENMDALSPTFASTPSRKAFSSIDIEDAYLGEEFGMI